MLTLQSGHLYPIRPLILNACLSLYRSPFTKPVKKKTTGACIARLLYIITNLFVDCANVTHICSLCNKHWGTSNNCTLFTASHCRNRNVLFTYSPYKLCSKKKETKKKIKRKIHFTQNEVEWDHNQPCATWKVLLGHLYLQFCIWYLEPRDCLARRLNAAKLPSSWPV